MKRKIGTIKISRDQHVAMFEELLDRYVEADTDLGRALNFMASKALKKQIPELRARRDEKRAALVGAYSDLLEGVRP